MSFWRELEDSSAVEELPPLTAATVAACEKKFGVKFPPTLLELLGSKNGGFLENTDFKFQGESFGVREIFGIGTGEGFREIRPCSTFMATDEPLQRETTVELRKKTGNLERLLILADNDYCWYGLDYNHLNSGGEPTVVWVVANEDGVEVRRVADSVAEFLKGQYFGDDEPLVHMEEAQRYTLVAEGGYNGTLKSTGKDVHVEWKICADGNRLIAFQREDWGFGEKRQRFELVKAALEREPIPLEDHGVEVEHELAELIRPIIEAECVEISEYDVPTAPKCYQLIFQLPPGTQTLMKQSQSEAYRGRWKNDSDKLIAASLYCGDKGALQRTKALLCGRPKKPKGLSWLGRFFR